VLYYLRKRARPVTSEIFSDIEVDPSLDTIQRGAVEMRRFQPDVIIALGGGSAIDAAKGMWLFYEQPDLDFQELSMKFMDIRKKIIKFPSLGQKARMVAIPTTSGTGSEVTSFSVITDPATQTKYPLADYELTPDVAIIDPQFVQSVPPPITADTGLDVLTHAIRLVFEWLPRAYHNGGNTKAREKMHNASCMAGMAFSNAFLGINHSLAHKLGGEYHISHGRANAILLPHVIAYNSQKPTKFVSFPKYETFIADRRYAEIARELNLAFTTTDEGCRVLIEAVRGLMRDLEMPTTIQEMGISEKTYFDSIPRLAEKAFDDQCTGTNPRYPLIHELEEIYRAIY
jgi:acetaldehyde dehydrogenase/alcohol dehydrogenase